MPISIKYTWNYLIISGYSYQQFSCLFRNFKFTLHDQIVTQTKKILPEHVYFMLTAQWYTTSWLFDLYWDDNNWGHSAQSYSQFRADKFGTRHSHPSTGRKFLSCRHKEKDLPLAETREWVWKRMDWMTEIARSVHSDIKRVAGGGLVFLVLPCDSYVFVAQAP